MVRRVYAIGTTHVPETSPEHRYGSARHRNLEAVWSCALDAKRLWYSPSEQGRMDGPPGSSFGLYALKYAVRGTECEAMDQRIIHVASLDSCFERGVEIKRITGCGPVRLMLLSNGVLVTLSEDPAKHGVVIPHPAGRASGAIITDAAAGEGHYVLCDSQGAVYSWGWDNSFGQQGRGAIVAPDTGFVGVHEPKRIPGFGRGTKLTTSTADANGVAPTVFESREAPNVVSVNCGRHHTVLLSDSGASVYTFGRGHCGQLGLGRPAGKQGAAALSRVEVMPVPRCVPCTFGVPVREIVCANDGHYTMLVLRNGGVVVWGENTTGAFGLGHSKSMTVPTPVHIADAPPAVSEQASNAADAAASSRASTDARQAVVPAAPATIRPSLPGPLEPRRIKKLVPPTKPGDPCPTGPAVVHASACLTHTALADCNGRLLTAGLRPIRVASDAMPVNALGPLGRRPTSKQDALTFAPVDGIFVDEEDRIACGDGYTAYLMRRQGMLFLVGSIAVEGRVLVGGGEEAHDLFNIAIGVGRRVVDVKSTCNGGLLMVIDEE